ncbi:unnamed protein product [Angiostrongylus costaricensis]|uniref:7TM_GPCR_Srx domain-containing protein n=1 Tax=Angiostrongylus costaricensis TaxID=334426 RepID=A0A0R3Q2N6_ANGCS|nr:unnamed protein product [Angiostrongylus costaricensis]
MVKYENPFHDHFFVFYIFFGSILLVLNLQTMLVIRRSKCLWALSAYRLIFFSSAADAVNCGAQVAAVAITFRTPVIHPTLKTTHQICSRRASAPVSLFPDIYAVGNLALRMVLPRF